MNFVDIRNACYRRARAVHGCDEPACELAAICADTPDDTAKLVRLGRARKPFAASSVNARTIMRTREIQLPVANECRRDLSGGWRGHALSAQD